MEIQSHLDLYLYYIINYAYVNVKTFNNLTTSTGGIHVTVDNSWFLDSSTTDQNLTMYGFYLPSTANVTVELSDPNSQYPRPFNFTVTQSASGNSNKTTTTNNSTSTTHSTDHDPSNHLDSQALNQDRLPGWAIAVIVIAVIALICGAAALAWITVISRRNKKNNKLIPIIAGSNDDNQSTPTAQQPPTSPNHEKALLETTSMNSSQAPILAYRSTESIKGSNRLDSFSKSMSLDEEEEEMRRRRLGEALLQRQLEEDGTSVKHAGRFTHVKSLADIQKSAIVEHPSSSNQ
ncbi:hypothetical protein G6F61_012276 [Rhizopus arrhizus]|nr:hypothetical protein G6F61_012276 [Rhizopus arrhizus]